MAPSSAAMHTSSVMEELRRLAHSRAKQQADLSAAAAAEPPERRRWGSRLGVGGLGSA